MGDIVAELEQRRSAHYGPDNTADLYEDDKKLAVAGAPLAGADIEPAFLRSQVRQRLRKAVGQRAHVGGERTINDVTFQPQFAAPVVDLFLFGALGLEAGRACRVLGQCAGCTEKLEQ